MDRIRYLVVEGPIGVGKTTLARLLADEFQGRLILEQVDENPFLRRFYDDPDKYAFPAQLFFLLTRYRQQQELAQQDLFHQNMVGDYLFAKDRIFAQVNLDADELAKVRADAERHGMTVSDWVRYSLRRTRRLEADGAVEDKLRAIEDALGHDHPTADIGQMLDEIERGYLDE